MKKLINIVIILLIICISLFLVDIFTGIWFWNRLNLEFSSSEFNNIITPVTGLIAIFIYYIALKYTQIQNKTINSYNLKEQFIKDIQKLRFEAKGIEVNLSDLYKTNFLEFEKVVLNIFTHELYNNQEYLFDSNNNVNINFIDDEIQKKSYYPQIHFLYSFVTMHSMSHGYYQKLKKFIEKVLELDMIENHKKNILEEIENELINDYLILISNIKTISKYSRKAIQYAILYTDPVSLNEKWCNILDTSFCDFYNWYQSIKNKAIKSNIL